MKLRIHNDTIRFRLTEEEISTLVTHGRVSSSLPLGPSPEQRLNYSVQICEDLSADARIEFESQGLEWTARVRAEECRTWQAGTDVEISARREWNGAVLVVILEKDLRRRHAV